MRHQRINHKKMATPTRPMHTKTSHKTPAKPMEQQEGVIGNREMGRMMESNPQNSLSLSQPIFGGLSVELTANTTSIALPATGGVIQPKLTLGTPGDIYEQEADSMARQVVEQIHSSSYRQQNTHYQGESQPEGTEAGQVQRQLTGSGAGDDGGELSSQWEGQLQSAKSGGQPLSPSLKQPMESAFGADFGGVRVHTGPQADRLARTIQAMAFTTGQDVYFRQGAYQPGNRGGQELLAHELTHVVQQTSSGNNSKILPKKMPVSAAPTGQIQRLKYGKLKKFYDPKLLFHQTLGKELLTAYRIMSDAAKGMRQGKSKEVLKQATLSLAKAAISVGAKVTGIPGLTPETNNIGGEDIGAEEDLNALEDTLAQEPEETEAENEPLAMESDDVEAEETEAENEPLAMESDDVEAEETAGAENTSLAGMLTSKIFGKVGTVNNAVKMLFNVLPLDQTGKSLAKGLQKGMGIYEQWKKRKENLLRQINDLDVLLGNGSKKNKSENLGDTEENLSDSEREKKNKKWRFFAKAGRGLTGVLAKYI